MKDASILLLCAVALAHGFDLTANDKARTCNCDPSEAQQICEANIGNDDVLIAHENCDKFYKCSNGKPVAYNCPADLLYNPVLEECDWPYNVDCGDRPISDGNDTVDPDCDDDTGGEDSVGDDNNDSGNDDTCNCNPGEAPSICAAEGSNGVFVAHENCNQFYQCAEGRPVTLDCPPTLLYNPYKEQCDWPQNVECGDRVIPEPDDDAGNDSGNDSDGNDNGGNDGTCNCNPEEAPTICAAPGSNGVLIAHENCNQFYICDNNKPVASSCPGELLFNPYTKQCDWPRNVDCGDRIVPETEGGCSACNDNGDSDEEEDLPLPDDDTDIDDVPPAGDDDGNNSVEIDTVSPPVEDDGNNSVEIDTVSPPVDDNNDGTCNCNPEEAPSICANENSDGILVAHENCNQFYKCDHGKPVVFTCYGNLLFNPYTEKCDWPERVDCGDRVIPDSENDNGGSDSGNDSGNDSGSDNGNDSGSDSGSNDNGGAGNCDPSEAPTICAADDSEGVLVAHENCNQFYICNGGKPVVLTCPENLLFNPNTDQCDWPHNVDCGDRVIPDPEDDDLPPGGDDLPPGGDDLPPGGDDLPPGGDDSGNDNGGGGDNNDNVGAGNCDPSEAPTICAADDSEGVLVAHENCNQFYICNGGKPVVLTCPANLLFNPDTDRCDWPHNVDCGDRVIPDPEDDDLPPGGDDLPPGGDDLPPGGDDLPPGGDDSGNDNGGGGDNNDNVGAGNCDPSEAPTICAADDSEGVLVAHENCNQFYICNGGKPVVLTCPANLLFNPDTDRCDWPHNVDCGDRVIPDPEDDDLPPGGDDLPPGGDDLPPGGDDLPPGGDDSGNDNGGGGDNNDNVGAGNCDPSEAPTICAADDSEGVLVAHENCNQFYICNGGKPVVLTCPANLLFNPDTDRCDWPHNVDCGDRVIPDPEDDDLPPGGDDLPPGGDDLPPGGDDLPPGGDDSGNDNGGGGDNNDNVGAGNCDPSEAPTICAADDSEGVLVAHENCNQFYICNGGKPVVLTCPANLLFNPDTDRCDWPHNVDCGDRVIPDPEDDDLPPGGDDLPPGGDDLPPGGDDLPPGGDDSGNDNGGGGDNNDNVGAGNCDPSEAPTICAADDSEGVLVAHENCNQFYICNGGKPVVLTCPANLLFNPDTDRCDWPHNVDCGDRVIPDPEDDDLPPGGDDLPPGGDDLPPGGDDLPPGGDDSGNDNGGGGDNNDNVGAGNCDPSEAPTICAADDSEGVLVAHENCNQFYICNGGKPVVLTCPANLLFNPDTDRCDWPHNVDCGDRVIPDPEDDDLPPGGDDLPPGGDDLPPGGDDLPPGGDDSGNDNGGDSDINDNVGAGNCDPSEAPSICAADDSEGVLVAHENCNQFYICNGGKPVVLTCPGNLLFNPNTDRCDWSHNVDCGDRVIPDPEDEDLSPGGNDSGNDSGDNDSGGSDNDGTCNCNPEEAPSICASENSDGVLIAHENCNQFYKCDHGKPVAFTCYGNLLYNPYTEKCDWPENVDCGDRVVPDGNDSGSNDDGNDSGSDGPDPDDDLNNDSDGNDNGSNDNNDPDPDDNLGNDSDGNGNDDDSDCDDNSGNENDETCNCKPDEAPSICANDGSDGVMIAHENCNQFYKCDNGKPVAFRCPSNLLYNPVSQVCDWPFNVECGDRVIPDSEEDDDNNNVNDSQEDDDTDNDNGGTCNCNPEEAPAICAVDGSDGVLIAHENCNQFYQCSFGRPVAITCASNLLYNPYIQACDWPSNVECGDRVIPEPEDNDNNSGVNDENDGDSGNNDVNDDPSQAPAICAGSGSEGVLVAHENCNQFYMCSGGSPVALSCAGELFFNPLINQCDWPRNVDCGDRIVPGGDDDCACNPRNAPALCARPDSNGKLIAHENCNQFYMCTNAVPVARDCPANLLYNIDKEVCDWPQNVNCESRMLSYASLNKHLESRQTHRK